MICGRWLINWADDLLLPFPSPAQGGGCRGTETDFVFYRIVEDESAVIMGQPTEERQAVFDFPPPDTFSPTGAHRRPDDPGGIGILREKTLHAALKLWLDGDIRHHEVTLPQGSVADIFDGERVTEIQTGSFSRLRPKLQKLLEHYDVTVVYPVIRNKQVTWIAPDTGEVLSSRRSPRTGRWTDAGKELIYIAGLLDHPRLTVGLVAVDVEEKRLADGWSTDGKRGAHRIDRLPTAVAATAVLRQAADYRHLLPAGLPDTFTAKEFGKLAHLQGRNLQGTLKVLLTTGVVRRERPAGVREYRYYVRLSPA